MLVLVLGCGSSSPSSSGPLAGTSATNETDDPRAYILGRGVARDVLVRAALPAFFPPTANCRIEMGGRPASEMRRTLGVAHELLS